MAWVYILRSLKDGKSYIGSTINLERRWGEHQKGSVDATKSRLPLELVAWQEFATISEAAVWEKKYKRSHGAVVRAIKSGKMRQVG